MPGPPFTFGAVLVILALIVALFIPENPHAIVKSPTSRRCSPLLITDDDLAETGHYCLECLFHLILMNNVVWHYIVVVQQFSLDCAKI